MKKFLWLLLVAGCAPAQLRPAPDRLQPWTTALRDQQPEDAFAAVYRIGSKHLIFLGAKHANRNDSSTFRLVREAYSHFPVDSVIVEGSPNARGPNNPRLIEYAVANSEVRDGLVAGGETVPAVLGARDEGATIWGGEASDLDVKARLFEQGFSAEDLLGFYVLRNIPQWVGEGKIENAADPGLQPLVEEALLRNREALALPADILPDYRAWANWYRLLNGKPIGADFITEEVGPLADGRFATNRIAAAISRSRAAFLHDLIVTRLAGEETLLVVFGTSHLMIHRPALDFVLGSPCYVGDQLPRAATLCR